MEINLICMLISNFVAFGYSFNLTYMHTHAYIDAMVLFRLIKLN